MKKRFLSILTALCLTLTLLPTAALAADEEVAEVNGERFETLQAAINAAETAASSDPQATVMITLLMDVTGGAVTFDQSGKYVLDLGGKTYTSNSNTDVIMIKQGNINLTIQNGSLIGHGSNTYGIYVYAVNASNTYDNVTVTLDGVRLDVTDQALGVQGLNSNNNLIVKNSSVNAGTAIYFPPKSGKLTIVDSVITGVDNAIVVKGGEVEISGDTTVRANGEPKESDEPYTGDPAHPETFPISGSAIYVEGNYKDNEGNARPITLDINGGTFISEHSAAVTDKFIEPENEAIQKVQITSGTFSSILPTKYCVDETAQLVGTDGNSQVVSRSSIPSDSIQADTSLNVYYVNETAVAQYYKAKIETADSIKYYLSLDEALSKATSDQTITLLDDVTYSGQISIPEGVTLDGGEHSLTAAEEVSNGGFINVTANNVTVQNITINTDGNAKHGVQFYVVEGGRISNATINGGYYTSVIVNGAEATLESCVFNPDNGAYANVEYAMGSTVTTIPEITLNNVTGNSGTPLVYADQDTADKIIADDSNSLTSEATGSEVAAVINEKIEGATVTLVYTPAGSGNSDNVPGTQIYTVTFNANGGTVSLGTVQTDNTGKLTVIPSASRPGYSLIGWYNEQGSAVNLSTYVFTADTNLTAQWSQNQSSSSSSSEPSYSPKLDVSDGGSIKVNPRTPEEDDEVTITVDPDSGYEVDKVTVTDRNGREVKVTAERDGTYTFTQPRGRVTISVTFVREGGSTFFSDVPESFWAYDEIAWAYDNGYVNGTSASSFSPNASISRQQVWMILARLSGADPANMSAAREWAVTNGVSDGTTPGGAVTRQQLVALLYRYATLMGYANDQRADLSAYPDAGTVAGYAVEPMQWSVANSIVGGTSNGTLDPTGTATRAQFAVILYRFWDQVG